MPCAPTCHTQCMHDAHCCSLSCCRHAKVLRYELNQKVGAQGSGSNATRQQLQPLRSVAAPRGVHAHIPTRVRAAVHGMCVCSAQYDGHYDYFFDTQNTANGGNRWSTCLMFLTDVEEGGETVGAGPTGVPWGLRALRGPTLPLAARNIHMQAAPVPCYSAAMGSSRAHAAAHAQVFTKLPTPTGQPNPAGFSDCAKHHLAVRPRKGDAVLFHRCVLAWLLQYTGNWT